MSRMFHPVRLLALVLLLGLLVGVPCVVIALTGSPFPGLAQLTAAWNERRVPSDLVVRCGLALFAALWTWFALTALAEFVHVWSARRRADGRPLAPLEPGPARWVRGLVRLVAIGAVGASFGALLPMMHSSGADPTPPTVPTTVVPVSVARVESSSDLAPFAAGLGTAVLFSAGAVSLLEARRRRQLRAAGVGARLTPPTAQEVRTETVLRSLSAGERIVRLDIALRAVAADLAAQGAVVLAVVLGDMGEVRLYLRGTAAPSDPRWTVDAHSNSWTLGGAVTLAELAPAARCSPQPCPAMAHLGGSAEGEVFVDIEAIGVLTVQSPWSVPMLRAISCSLALSPLLGGARVLTVGLGAEPDPETAVEVADSLVAAIDAASSSLGSTPSAGSSTFALRAGGAGGELWEPFIVVAADQAVSPSIAGRVGAVGAGRGLAVVVDSPGFVDTWLLAYDGDHHLLAPLGLRVHPVGLTEHDVAGVHDVLEAATEPLVAHAEVVPISAPALLSASAESFAEREWSLLVRVLGRVEVVSCAGQMAAFDRSKSLELVVWLSQHRERSTRGGARTALWDLDVRDATFANVVSDARRALARTEPPPDGEEWIGRTLTELLPLHSGVVTDAELLSDRVAYARGLPSVAAIDVLRPGVELLCGLPFADTSYLWTDAEGITSSLVLLATGAAIELANHYLALGDIDGVFWATGQGLKVLAGHEELIALRMRAHSRRGDLAGVRSEWESYERALAADPWAAAEPAPKLVALRRELLAPHTGGPWLDQPPLAAAAAASLRS